MPQNYRTTIRTFLYWITYPTTYLGALSKGEVVIKVTQLKKIFSFSFSESSVDLDDSGSSSVYAQNLDLHLQTTDNADDVSIAVQFHKFCKKI